MDREIEFGEYVQPACLPDAEDDERFLYGPGVPTLISGWGSTRQDPWGSWGDTEYPDALQAAVVYITSQKDCEEAYYPCKFIALLDREI